MAYHDDDMEFERELDLDYVAERVVAVGRGDGEGTNPNASDPIQAFSTLSAMPDAQMAKCMKPITMSSNFNGANPCTITITAPTFHQAARAVIDILQHGNSSLPDELFESPPGVTVSDITQCEPVCFLDVRTSYEVFVVQHLWLIGN